MNMKSIIKKVSLVMMLAVMMIGVTSCQKTNMLNGSWEVINNNSSIASNISEKFDFNPNLTYKIEAINHNSGETAINESDYILNWIDQVIIFSNLDGRKQEYKIVNLTNDKLQIEKVCKKGDPKEVITLKRVA